MATVDRAVGGALNLATGGLSGEVLGMLGERGRILGLGRAAARGLGDRLRGADGRAARTRLLDAAHTVIVVLAFFEVLQETELPFAWDDVRLTRREQVRLVADRPPALEGLVPTLAQVDAPRPAPHLPYEDTLGALGHWYESLGARIVRFLEGLDLWARLPSGERQAAADTVRRTLPRHAVERYEELYRRLVQEAPEFLYWTGQLEHQATRAELRRALARLEEVLSSSALLSHPPVHAAQALARAARAALGRHILAADSPPEGLRMPTLDEVYLDPDFKVRAVGDHDNPADEEWWAEVPVRRDLTDYLAGALTSPGLWDVPLLVLGQPGAGKSVLTMILAARLPATGFLPVRVALRDVRADHDLQDQLEQAVRDATGERVGWPELVRSAGTAVPVLLLDGFDELLQTTGVQQSDFLKRVARFQEREREQGRPVVALVTSRTAVADRAQHPSGTVALRLEPFQPDQIKVWIRQWNNCNARGLVARGLSTLSWELIAPHRRLAEQPLLLTMLALFHGAGNDFQGEDGRPLDEAELYEALLTSFARREVQKDTVDALWNGQVDERVESELQRLSIVAFSMLNRRRQWVSSKELEDDLGAVYGKSEERANTFREPLDQAEVALGRFFFVQRAQSIRGGERLSSYEFLHATFGEYLAVRLAVQQLVRLLGHRPALSLSGEPLDDDLLYTLLSFAPLFSRQMLRFARACVGRLSPEERHRLADLVVRVHWERGRQRRDKQPYPAYCPRLIRVSARHGIYSANLVMLVVLLTGATTAGTLFPTEDDPGDAWHAHTLLWRASLPEVEWADFALALNVSHVRDAAGRDLHIRLRQEDDTTRPEVVDAHWLYQVSPREAGHVTWHVAYWDDMWHKAHLAAGTNEGVLLQVAQPLLAALGPLVTTFNGGEGDPGTSVVHDLLCLWLDAGSALPVGEVVKLYARIAAGLDTAGLDGEVGRRLLPLLCDLLDRDRVRLGPQARPTVEALVSGLPRELREYLNARYANLFGLLPG
ncbi:hypothetical protein PV343_10605 [Streptomyces sp. WI03-4A]|uniref:NACHT domain-containing protein n=1 Tax=Streptomyces sp. WI03-4A TaxID=3028706 RepID=UPI0029B40331|nr:hypothetical protein [Streptomyces sp. WI03-4A]MDX2592707.1 hypothetical protein [Streptomyces sp. WI03-4A]